MLDDQSKASPESAAKMETLALELRRAMEARDWEAVSGCFGEEAGMTAEKAEAAFGPRLERSGPIPDASVWYIEFDGTDYLNYVVDEGEIPGPPEAYRGKADISVGSRETDLWAFRLFTFVGEVEGRFVLLYWESL